MDKPFIEQGTGGPAYGSGAPEFSEQQKITIVGDASCGTFATFIINKEDHTLGNIMRSMLAQNPDVEFCGYTIPHPSKNEIHLRIQTYEKPVTEPFEKALKDLTDVCQYILEKFKKRK